MKQFIITQHLFSVTFSHYWKCFSCKVQWSAGNDGWRWLRIPESHIESPHVWMNKDTALPSGECYIQHSTDLPVSFRSVIIRRQPHIMWCHSEAGPSGRKSPLLASSVANTSPSCLWVSVRSSLDFLTISLFFICCKQMYTYACTRL